MLGGRAAPGTEVVPGDLLQPASLDAAFAGVDTAFYLVHALQSGAEFESLEKEAASNFASAAGRGGLRRIIFLGGLPSAERKETTRRRPSGESARVPPSMPA